MNSKQWKLASRPVGMPTAENFSFAETELRPLEPGEVLTEILLISLDPAMRGWMNQSRSYVPPVRIGQVMRAGTIARVLQSNSEHFKPGDFAAGLQGVQTHGIAREKDLTLIRADEKELPSHLGALGMPGMTAWFGLFDVGALQPGEEVVISAAAGAVGSVAGQLAKIHGCRVTGIAGGAEKCAMLTGEFGFDAAIDYRSEEPAKMMRKHHRDGIDVYFDNVGGSILEAALFNIRRNARIIICGAISQYNTEDVKGPANYLSLLVNRARMQGFVVFDYEDRYAEAREKIAGYIRTGKLKEKFHTDSGIENFPATFLKLFTGENRGKLLLRVN